MKIRILTAGVAAATLVVGLAGCAGDSSAGTAGGGGSEGGFEGTTLTYWATNQGASLEQDAEILQPELDKFEEQTGITVELEVIPWTDMTNNTLAAAVSGQGPDVVNIGNTNATTFQTTGAFMPFDDEALKTLGGEDHFVDSAFGTAGPPGSPVTSIPLYSQVYALFYNKQMFADAGLEPPATWEDLVSVAQTLTDPAAGTWGISVPAGTVNNNMHMSFIFTEQNGGSPFDDEGNPTFTTDEMVTGVKQYVDLMSEYGVTPPGTVEYTSGTQSAQDFATGKFGMYFGQTSATSVLATNGMDPDQYGIVHVPWPEGGEEIGSFVAGTNISIFASSKKQDAALEFVKFMTSEDEQLILNKAYGTLPAVEGVEAAAFESDPEKLEQWQDILANYAKPLPLVPNVSAFQANVGTAVVGLFSKAATGEKVSEDDVRAAMVEAEQKMATG